MPNRVIWRTDDILKNALHLCRLRYLLVLQRAALFIYTAKKTALRSFKECSLLLGAGQGILIKLYYT
jgi:hypothetical protein